jgi:hypothetical protein
MSRPLLGRSAIVDTIESKERTNAIQKREGLTEHPVRFSVCGWHTIETNRKVPSQDECAEMLKADNSARKIKKHRDWL